MKQVLNLGPAKGGLEKITLVYFHIFQRKILLRLAAGVSLDPAVKAVKIDFLYHFSRLLFNSLCLSAIPDNFLVRLVRIFVT